MSRNSTTPSLLFPELFDRPVVAQFDQHHGSSDGGAVLLKAADCRLGLTEALASALTDRRQSGKIAHELIELLGQRIFAIACGYPDANDAARLGEDPIHKLLVGRDPIAGSALASQPTLSRFENGLDRKALYRMGEALAERVIDQQRKRLHGRARQITIDLDVTDDPTHGVQQLAYAHAVPLHDLDQGLLARDPRVTGLAEPCADDHDRAHAPDAAASAVATTCAAETTRMASSGASGSAPTSG